MTSAILNHDPAFARRVLDGAFTRIDVEGKRFVYLNSAGEWIDPKTLKPFTDADVLEALEFAKVHNCTITYGRPRVVAALDALYPPPPRHVYVRNEKAWDRERGARVTVLRRATAADHLTDDWYLIRTQKTTHWQHEDGLAVIPPVQRVRVVGGVA